MMHDRRNVRFRLGIVTGVDWDTGRLLLDDGSPQPFDGLVLGGRGGARRMTSR
jgi:NADH dehydrogenase FAD-containing subunit